MFDSHIHMMKEVRRDEFFHSVHEAGISGGILLSLPPGTFDNNTYSPSEGWKRYWNWRTERMISSRFIL